MRYIPLISVFFYQFSKNMEFCWIAVTRTLHSSELTVSSCISYDELLAVQLPNVTESKCVAEVKNFLSYQYGEMAAIAFIIIAGGGFHLCPDTLSFFVKSVKTGRFLPSECSETVSLV